MVVFLLINVVMILLQLIMRVWGYATISDTAQQGVQTNLPVDLFHALEVCLSGTFRAEDHVHLLECQTLGLRHEELEEVSLWLSWPRGGMKCSRREIAEASKRDKVKT